MTSLLKLQIGPVQDFIAQARSTRDLWSGSYLLSSLIAAGARQVNKSGGNLIFPNSEKQPLLKDPSSWMTMPKEDQKELLTPNLPNLFVAELESDSPSPVAHEVEQAIRDEWHRIAEECFSELHEKGILDQNVREDFLAQAQAFLSIAWQITPLQNEYSADYTNNGRHLDAVRQVRHFHPNPITRMGEKDSLSGRDHAFVGGTEFKKEMANRNDEYRGLFKHSDHLSAIALIKRVWHLAYLKKVHKLRTSSEELEICSTRAIAARTNERDDDENTDAATGEKYLAAIAFDGDSIGKWIKGDPLPPGTCLKAHHSNFSAALSDFALGKARSIVEGHDGFLIYAGGDDVLALVPADAALEAAEELRLAFKQSTDKTPSINEKPDASAGIAIAHFKSPLQDLVQEAQRAEKRAKTTVGKPAFSITLMKRSGEISEWGAKWDSQAIQLYNIIFKALCDGSLSKRFPHRIIQLLTPYLTYSSELAKDSNSQPEVLDPKTATMLISREFGFAIDRQSDSNRKEQNKSNLVPLLEDYLSNLESGHSEDAHTSVVQSFFESLIGLCSTVAFNHRNLPQPSTTESQLA